MPYPFEDTKHGPRKRGLLDVDRRDGQTPISIDTLGDLVYVWTTTGLLAPGEMGVVFLTSTLTAGGESVFTKAAIKEVMRGEAGEVLPRGWGPVDPKSRMNLYGIDPTWVAMKWVPAEGVWSLEITNGGSEAYDFDIVIGGV